MVQCIECCRASAFRQIESDPRGRANEGSGWTATDEPEYTRRYDAYIPARENSMTERGKFHAKFQGVIFLFESVTYAQFAKFVT